MTYKTPTSVKASFESGDVPVQQDFVDFIDSVHLEQPNALRSGLTGDGTTDDSAALQAVVSANNYLVLASASVAYEAQSVSASSIFIEGRNWPTLRTPSAGQEVIQLLGDDVVEYVRVDGEGDTANKVEASGSNHVFQHNILVNCTSNSYRLGDQGSGVFYLYNQSSASKAFNTNDSWTGTNVTLVGGQYLGITGEGVLFDAPAVTAQAWHGVVHALNQYELAASSEKAFGVARVVGGVSIGNVYRGNSSVTEELVHVEDKAEKWLFVGELVDTNGAPEAYDSSLAGDAAFPQTDRDPKNLAFMSLAMFCGGTAKGMEFQGAVPDEFEKVTIDGAHIDQPTVPVDARLQEGAIINTVSYDPAAPITVITSQNIDNPNEDSPNAHNIYVTNNHAIRPTYIRGNVGTCFDPNSLLWRYSFANEGTLPTPPTGGPGSSAVAAFGGSVGTGGTITYPLSVAGDGIAGCKYQRATAGTTAMTRRIDIDFTPELEDIQNGDCISVQIMCRSSVANRGRLVIGFPLAGPGDTDYDLPTTTDWQVLGATKRIDAADDLFTGTGIEIDIFLGQNLANTETFDIAWIKVSHVRAY